MKCVRSFGIFLFIHAVSSVRVHDRSSGLSKSRLNVGRVIPDLSSTESQLDQLEGTLSNWSPAKAEIDSIHPDAAGKASNSPETSSGPNLIPAVTTSKVSTNSVNSETTLPAVDDLSQKLANIENQSNNNIAQVTGGVASNGILIDLIRVNVSRLATEVRRNITRLQTALDELGTSSASGQDSSFRSIAGQTGDLQGQVNQIQSTLSEFPQVSDRINNLGNTVQNLQSRISSLEYSASNPPANVLAQADQSKSSSQVDDSSGIGSLVFSWSGRAALLGLALGLIALSLSILTFLRIPQKQVSEQPVEEQVLLEAGGEELNNENAEQGEEVEGGEEAVEQVYEEEEQQ